MAQPKSILKGKGFVLQESAFYEGKYIAVKSIFGEVVLVSNSIESMIGICGLIAPYTEIDEGMTDDVALFAKKYVSYACDTNQVLIAKQAEQIKVHKNQIAKIIMLHKQASLGGDASVDALFELADFIELLEATKE